MRDNDLNNKQKGKDNEDDKRKTKETKIRPGNKVIVQNTVLPHKLTPKLNIIEYEVLERQGNEAALIKYGRLLKRYVSHLKKLPELTTNSHAPLPEELPPQSSTSPTGPPQQEEAKSSPGVDDRQLEPESQARTNGEGNLEQVKPFKLKKMDGMWRPVKE